MSNIAESFVLIVWCQLFWKMSHLGTKYTCWNIHMQAVLYPEGKTTKKSYFQFSA